MRKILALCLVLMMLTSCAAVPMTALQTAPTPMVAPASQSLQYVVQTVQNQQTVQAKDGTKLAEIDLELPKLTVLRPDGTEVVLPQNNAEKTALKVAETFGKQFQEWIGEENIAELTQLAREDYAFRPEFFTDGNFYTEELKLTIYQTEKMVSVYGNYFTFTGGAHPNTVLLGWNFDLTSGTFLDASTLSADVGGFLNAVTEEIVAQMESRATKAGSTPTEVYWENYREIVAEWNNYAVFFNADGMTVAFSPYELACHAAGPQEFTLPYETLRPWLSDHGVELLGLQEK